MWLLDTNSLIIWKKTKNNFSPSSNSIFTSIFNIIEHPPALAFKFLTIIYPTQLTYEKCVIYTSKLRSNGTPMHAIDLLIGTLAIEHQLALVTNDNDFNAFNKIETELELITWEDFVKTLNDGDFKHLD
jgi:predicted nucleic acid-binding protein